MPRALAIVLLLIAADRSWQSGTWGTPRDERTYVILNSVSRLELEDRVPGNRRALEITSGASVKFAIEKDDVYVLDRTGSEHRLHLLRQVSLVYEGVGGGHYIKAVGPGGHSVTLEDGSVWEIDPSAYFITEGWVPLEGIAVRTTAPDNGFNYEIDNTEQDTGALARYTPP